MADFNLATHRGKPQYGWFETKFDEESYWIQVSATPALYGDKLTLKIADVDVAMHGLAALGFTPETQARLEYMARQSAGLLLFAGPRGSGRSTTQYSLLNKLNSAQQHLLTIEPYSSYRLAGVTQVELRRTRGLTVGEVWRTARDVNILHVERVCDAEMAEMAVSAAEAGTLVLAAVDAPDSAAALNRLAELGIPVDRIERSVLGVLAQRLVRTICMPCKHFYDVDANEMRRFGFRPSEPGATVTLARGLGCESCGHSGYRGRLGLFELLTMNAEIAELVGDCGFGGRLVEAAKANGMRPMREDGLVKVLEGLTCPEEVLRAVPG